MAGARPSLHMHASKRVKRYTNEDQAAGEHPNAAECPVCMETFTQFGPRSRVKAFGCSHATCRACDDSLFRRADDRCPMCRSSRTDASRASHPPAAQQQHNEALRAREMDTGTHTIFFATRVNTDTMDDQDHADFMLRLQRTLLALHSRTLGEDLHEFATGPSAASASREAPQPLVEPLPVRDPAVRAVLHSLTEAASYPLESFHRLASRVRAARRSARIASQASADI